MNTDRKLMQQALEKLEFFAHMKSVSEDTRRLITALRERLAQPEQEPDIYPDEAYEMGLERIAYYAAPQPAPQPLTDEQIREFYGDNNNFEITGPYVIAFARAIEAAHGIGDKPDAA
jgi:hypothetical protein